jgi:hypothetical protein
MNTIIHNLIAHLANFYNIVEHYWHGDKNHRILGSLIVVVFLLSLGLIFMNRMGWIQGELASYVPTHYFSAIVNAFWVLLLFEIFSLIFVLPGSVSSSMLKQFEIFSLILLRDVFKSIQNFPEPIAIENISASLLPMALDAFGALLVFIGIYHIRKLQLHKSITSNQKKQNQFIEIKKVLSLFLIFIFIGIAVYDAYLFFTKDPVFQMFTLFYTVMIFFDIIILLISLRYNLSFEILFRYSGFTIATIMLRLSLSAPAIYKAGIGVTAILFVFFLTMYYSKFIMVKGHNREV